MCFQRSSAVLKEEKSGLEAAGAEAAAGSAARVAEANAKQRLGRINKRFIGEPS
jgi:hypothetical protein